MGIGYRLDDIIFTKWNDDDDDDDDDDDVNIVMTDNQ